MPFLSQSSVSDADIYHNAESTSNWTNRVMLEMQMKQKYSILSNLLLARTKQVVYSEVAASELIIY